MGWNENDPHVPDVVSCCPLYPGYSTPDGHLAPSFASLRAPCKCPLVPLAAPPLSTPTDTRDLLPGMIIPLQVIICLPLMGWGWACLSNSLPYP